MLDPEEVLEVFARAGQREMTVPQRNFYDRAYAQSSIANYITRERWELIQRLANPEDTLDDVPEIRWHTY